MNGNSVVKDNAKDVNGRHENFYIIQNYTDDILKEDFIAFRCYTHLLRVGGSEYNVTIANLARDLKMTKKTASRGIDKLVELGLLDVEAEKDITGEKMTKIADGIRVPNTRKRYTVYMLPKNKEEAKISDVKNDIKPVVFDTYDFTDDIKEEEQEMARKQAKVKIPSAKQQNIKLNADERMLHLKALLTENEYKSFAENAKMMELLKEHLKNFYRKNNRTATDKEVLDVVCSLHNERKGGELKKYVQTA